MTVMELENIGLVMSSQVSWLEDFTAIISIFPCERKINKVPTRINCLSKDLCLYKEDIV